MTNLFHGERQRCVCPPMNKDHHHPHQHHHPQQQQHFHDHNDDHRTTETNCENEIGVMPIASCISMVPNPTNRLDSIDERMCSSYFINNNNNNSDNNKSNNNNYSNQVKLTNRNRCTGTPTHRSRSIFEMLSLSLPVPETWPTSPAPAASSSSSSSSSSLLLLSKSTTSSSRKPSPHPALSLRRFPSSQLSVVRQLTFALTVLGVALLAVKADQSTTPLVPGAIGETAASAHTNSNSAMYNNDYHNRTTQPSAATTTTAGSGVGRDSILLALYRRFAAGNELWDGIIGDCYLQPSYSCFQKNIYGYLNSALDARDVNVTQRVQLFKNQVEYEEHAETTEAAAAQDVHEESDEEEFDRRNALPSSAAPNNRRQARAENVEGETRPETTKTTTTTPIEEVTNALYGKSIKFAMTHDLELKMPEMLFDGATFKISPRSFEGNGIIAKLEVIPRQQPEARLAGKFFLKKFQKFMKNKMMLSFLAIVLIIKIIKIKFFWLLPLVIGVGAAKKLLLKFLLFLFPALSHLFKLCAYYQQSYHSTKFHHHHHLINHHHTIVPNWHSGEQHSVPEIIYTNPPKGHVSAYLHGAPIHETYGPPSEHYDGWESSGPGLGSEYLNDVNRAALVDENASVFKPQTTDSNEINGWGLAVPPNRQKQRFTGTQQPRPPLATNPYKQHQSQQQQLPPQQQPQPPPPPSLQAQATQTYQKPYQTSSHSFNPFTNTNKQSLFGMKYSNAQPYGAQSLISPVYTPPRTIISSISPHSPGAPLPPQPLTANGPSSIASNHAGGGLTAAQIVAQYEKANSNNVQQQASALSPELSAELKEAIRIQNEQRIVQQQQKILQNQPFVQDGPPLMPKDYDPFYSPILVKVDKILEQLGVTDDLCKERLICSMYKDPSRYSPHSNFVSAELSRDTNELESPAKTNAAVLRFYRLIQAARDGQEQKDCLQLYPKCNINTE